MVYSNLWCQTHSKTDLEIIYTLRAHFYWPWVTFTHHLYMLSYYENYETLLRIYVCREIPISFPKYTTHPPARPPCETICYICHNMHCTEEIEALMYYGHSSSNHKFQPHVIICKGKSFLQACHCNICTVLSGWAMNMAFYPSGTNSRNFGLNSVICLVFTSQC